MSKWRLFGLVAALALGQFVAVGKMSAGADDLKAKGEAAPGKGKRAQEFIAAFNRGDAKAVAALKGVRKAKFTPVQDVGASNES